MAQKEYTTGIPGLLFNAWKETRQVWLEAPLVVNSEGTLFVGAKDLKTVFIYDGATGAHLRLPVAHAAAALDTGP